MSPVSGAGRDDASRGCPDWADDAAAFALGALPPEEAERFGAHLSACPGCRGELEALYAVSERLAFAAPQFRAPRSLRRAVLSCAAPATPHRGLAGRLRSLRGS